MVSAVPSLSLVGARGYARKGQKQSQCLCDKRWLSPFGGRELCTHCLVLKHLGAGWYCRPPPLPPREQMRPEAQRKGRDSPCPLHGATAEPQFQPEAGGGREAVPATHGGVWTHTLPPRE